jgi:two-component system chemotaxis sensor kinase CheA
MENNDQILDEFLMEAQEIFDQLDLDFVLLEQTPQDKKLLGSIFRAMHTLKGSSGFFSFRRLEKVAHAGESLLSKVRDGVLAINLANTNALLKTLDCLRGIINGIAANRVEPEGDDTALLALLRALTQGDVPPEPATVQTNAMVATAFAAAQAESSAAAVVATATAPAPTPATAATPAPEPAPKPAPANSPAVSEPLVMSDSDQPVSDETGLVDAANVIGGGDAPPKEPFKTNDVVTQVRVNVDLLDKLMNLVSEMVLARNRLVTCSANSVDASLLSTVRAVDFITLELQERMMLTRMQQIGSVWLKFPRLVRDAATETGKKVELVQVGGETELDRSVLETIRDPLIHIIRNAVDHGIELPHVRLSKGKKETGTVTLSSSHESGMIIIDVTDDGGGINLPLVVRKAVEKGMITEERVQKIAYGEIIDLVCMPGFSTKDEITTMSGRGVGLDVVRTNVQKIGGSVDIRTSEQGTKIRLRIPLTMAIMPALFVECGGQTFALPQSNLFEMIRHDKSRGNLGVEEIDGVPVIRLRSKLTPLIYMNSELKLNTAKLSDMDSLNIVVVQVAGMHVGLIVDKVLFMQEVVVKSVGEQLRSLGIYSGATILGNGRVAMIFDVNGLAIRSGLISKLNDKGFRPDVPEAVVEADNTETMLMFDLVNLKKIAIPLYYVDRLEMLPVARIEHRGAHDVILYRDKIMKLIWLSDIIETPDIRNRDYSDYITVIVHYNNGVPIGFVVKYIRDIMQINPEIILISPRQQGIMGSSIVGDSVVSILNVQEVLEINQFTQSFQTMANQDPSIRYESKAEEATS